MSRARVAAVVGVMATVGLLGAAVPIAGIGGGNALTLPAQRHLVRIVHPDGSESLFLALQQDTAGSGLGLFRSDDQGASWRREAGIQPDPTHRDTADLLAWDRDVALVYSYEGPGLAGSSRHDVYFQWWRYDAATRALQPSAPVQVFDSTSDGEAYYRAELVRDSLDRIWVQAFRLGADGRHTAEVKVSIDGGQTFAATPSLADLPYRGGGRILSLDGSLLFLYSHHGVGPASFRTRHDSDPLDSWSAAVEAFPEGIYHGAALSAVPAGGGQFHLVYRAASDERLWYRLFDGALFGPRLQVDATTDWALQAGTSLRGSDLVIFYNRVRVSNLAYDIYARVLRGGALTEPVLLDDQSMFKGYPAALERVPSGWAQVPCAWGFTFNASVGGEARLLSWGPPAPPTDAGVPDGGTPDGGAPDGGPPDGGAPDGGASEVLLFSDAFNRRGNGLGAGWSTFGLWLTDGRAISDLDGEDLAHAAGATCSDCRVEARAIGFGVPEVGLIARARPANPRDRYDLVLLSNGRLRIRKHLSGGVQVLGEAPSGLTDLTNWAHFQLTVQGTGPVRLSASVNGALKLVVVDSAPGALAQAGSGGLWTTRAGVWFDDFKLWALGAGGGSPDAGVPDAGVPDAGVPDAGVPDAGAPDAGAPDAGSPHPDAGTSPPDGGTALSFDVVAENKSFAFLGVAGDGTALAVKLGDSRTRLYASADGARTWALRTTHQSSFWVISRLSDGTLIADVTRNGRHYLSRSDDNGYRWQDVLDLGSRRMLTPHSVADLDGTAYFAEYQTDTQTDAPIRLWASTDRGRSWTVRFTFQGHRHAHGLGADAQRHALWVYFGDTTRQSGIFRSLDQGWSWTKMLGNQQGNAVDAVVTGDGLLFGQDISYLPELPHIARLSFSGAYVPITRIPGPAYSSFGLSAGGYLVGAARESGGDIYPPGEVSAHVFVSADGASWTDAFQFPRASAAETVRADVYWELPSGEVVLQLINAQGFGPGGMGYLLLRPVRR